MLVLALVSACFFIRGHAAPVNNSVIVDLGYAKYLGTAEHDSGTNAWYGIHYAADPSGDQRFRAPRPIETDGGLSPGQLINATVEGPICVQGFPAWTYSPTNPPAVTGIEDCLVLDILVPQSPRSTALPVMVEIHGGGYVQGSAGGNDGHGLMQHSANSFVYVAIQYRLGPYGFLAAQDVKNDGTANAGLLDQRLALEWVHNHIGQFGGDPDQITINGGSAGGGSVTSQLMLYGGTQDKIFRAAIAEYPWWQTYHNQTTYEDQYKELLNITDCGDLTCLRGVSAATLSSAAETSYVSGYRVASAYGFGDFYYGPALDGDILRDYPSNAFANGAYQQVPLLVDHDGYEGTHFTDSSLQNQDQVFALVRRLFPHADNSFFQGIQELYPASDFNSSVFQYAQIIGDAFIVCPTTVISHSASVQGQPVWKLRFDAGDQAHGATGAFLFGASEANSSGNDPILASVMKDWMVSFVVHNDPNAEQWSNASRSYWSKYLDANSTSPSVMNVEGFSRSMSADMDWNDACRWWPQRANDTMI